MPPLTRVNVTPSITTLVKMHAFQGEWVVRSPDAMRGNMLDTRRQTGMSTWQRPPQYKRRTASIGTDQMRMVHPHITGEEGTQVKK